MDKCPNPEQLPRFLADELSAAEADSVADHIGECATCQKILDRLTAFTLDEAAASFRAPSTDSAFFRKLKAMTPWHDRDFAKQLPEIAGYEVLVELGRGGMGVVYKARHVRLNRAVALKMVLAGRFAGPNEMLRFHIEAEAIAALSHPHSVQVHEVGESDGYPYLALEFIEGGTLAGRLQDGPMSPRQSAMLLHTLASAADCAHRRGVIHRDLSRPTYS